MDPTATPNLKGQPGMAEVNEAYRIENGDEVKMIRNSWDDSNKESQMSNSHRPAMVTETATEELPRDASWEAMQKSQRIAGNEARLKATSQNPENCCVIEVSEGAYDNRYRPSFFHGSENHFHIKGDDPKASIANVADKSEVLNSILWREMFGVLQIIVNFFIIFVLELFKTIIRSVRYLLTGILYTIGDHLMKPLLSAIFNNFVQPPFVFALNVFTILGNVLKPILALTREILSQVTIPLRACRLFVFNWEYKGQKDSACRDIKVV